MAWKKAPPPDLVGVDGTPLKLGGPPARRLVEPRGASPFVRAADSALYEPVAETPLDLSDIPSKRAEPPPVAGVVRRTARGFGFGTAVVVALVAASAGTWLFWRTARKMSLDPVFLRSLAPKFVTRAATRAAAEQPATEARWSPLVKDDAVLVEIDVRPRDARLLLDGDPLPSNPLRLPRSTLRHKVVGMADGMAAAEAEFVPDRAQTVRLRLSKQK